MLSSALICYYMSSLICCYQTWSTSFCYYLEMPCIICYISPPLYHLLVFYHLVLPAIIYCYLLLSAYRLVLSATNFCYLSRPTIIRCRLPLTTATTTTTTTTVILSHLWLSAIIYNYLVLFHITWYRLELPSLIYYYHLLPPTIG